MQKCMIPLVFFPVKSMHDKSGVFPSNRCLTNFEWCFEYDDDAKKQKCFCVFFFSSCFQLPQIYQYILEKKETPATEHRRDRPRFKLSDKQVTKLSLYYNAK